jgi:hypothetical protein
MRFLFTSYILFQVNFEFYEKLVLDEDSVGTTLLNADCGHKLSANIDKWLDKSFFLASCGPANKFLTSKLETIDNEFLKFRCVF